MNTTSVIGSGAVVHGHLECGGAITIEGRVEGSVRARGEVFVGEGAYIGGSVTGTSLRIAGEVLGNLEATELVSIESTGRVVGDSVAPQIGIADGALISGHVQTHREPRAEPEHPPAMQPPFAKVPTHLEARPFVSTGALPKRAPPAPRVPILQKGLRAVKRKPRGS